MAAASGTQPVPIGAPPPGFALAPVQSAGTPAPGTPDAKYIDVKALMEQWRHEAYWKQPESERQVY